MSENDTLYTEKLTRFFVRCWRHCRIECDTSGAHVW